jgi:hypothetical protein
MKIAVAIETKDRRISGGTNYIGETLRNLRRTDFWSSPALHSLRIVSGGELDDFVEAEIEPNIPTGASLEYILPPPICTRQQNGARAIRAGAETDADWVVKLEDDLDFIDTFMESLVAWLSDYGHAHVPMFSLAATFQEVRQSRFEPGESLLLPGPSFPRARAMMARGDAIAAHQVAGYWGAQALVWKRPMAVQLASWLGDDPFLWDGKEQHRERGHDLLLQVWGRSLEAKAFAVAVPSFVQHIGVQSNIHNPFFEFPFPGRQWLYQRRTTDA